jgi:uncharacterized protein YjbI with pentapeptide repeats
MNDEGGAASAAGSPVGSIAAPLRPQDLAGRDLKGWDLTKIEGLLPDHLAGTILTGARLPPEIAKFEGVGQVKAISAEARKVFIGLLAACVYCWLVIGTTTDLALILNTATTPLPIINTPIPIAGFYVVGAALLAAVYCYLHFYLLRLWRTLATLPAVFPDGVALDDKTDPWLLTNLVRTEFPHLRATAPPLARLENLLTIVLAWWIVPVTLVALWARYLPRHDIVWLVGLAILIAATTLFGRHSFRLAKATLRREPDRGSHADGERGVLGRAVHELGRLRPDKLTVWLTLALAVVSFSAFVDSPRSPDYWTIPRALDLVGIRTYANLREAEVAERPENWDGDWSKVTRVDLSNRNLVFADATRAFLASADLRGANLTGAILERADLRGAVLYDEDSGRIARLGRANLREAQLQDADLREAQLQGANLNFAQLQGANLSEAQLQGANLSDAQLQDAKLWRTDLRGARLVAVLQGALLYGAQLQGAFLQGAQLQDANLRQAQLQDADLRYAELQGAYLGEAQLQGADLTSAQLQGANLTSAQLQDADLESAQLQGGNLTEAQLQGADLLGAQLQGADLLGAQLQGADLWDADLRGADLRGAQLQGAFLYGAWLQGADLRRAALWRAFVIPELAETDWDLADLRGAHVRPLADAAIRALIAGATSGISDDERRMRVTDRMNEALITGDRPPLPDPKAWFERGDPEPEPLEWSRLKWDRPEEYDKDLAEFLGDLACGRDVLEAQTRGLAWRAFRTTREEPQRIWPRLFADRVTGPDCPPAAGLPTAVPQGSHTRTN